VCSNPDTWAFSQGKVITSDELVKKIEHVLPFLKHGGGVTFSGGEPLLQPTFTKTVFQQVKDKLGLTTCIDTAGHVAERNMDMVLPHVDHVLFCIKHPREEIYQKFTGKTQTRAKLFLKKLDQYKTPFTMRYIIIPGYTDSLDDIDAIIKICKRYENCRQIELLPYHTHGKHKWKLMNLAYTMDHIVPPSKQDMNFIKNYIEMFGVKVL
jgi:pyruvate formate lyase activating enzyme